MCLVCVIASGSCVDIRIAGTVYPQPQALSLINFEGSQASAKGLSLMPLAINHGGHICSVISSKCPERLHSGCPVLNAVYTGNRKSGIYRNAMA